MSLASLLRIEFSRALYSITARSNARQRGSRETRVATMEAQRLFNRLHARWTKAEFKSDVAMARAA